MTPPTATQLLRLHWGYSAFRPLQEEIIESVVAGRDTLALLPTGGGKSICYQIPALLQEGVCLVVSPLIALMDDQVRQLKARGIAAEALHSALPYPELDRIFDNAVLGNLKLLYLSPERLKTDMARERIRKMKVNLLAVDEAHCISQWGYDFRPAYLEIAQVREWLPRVPVLALTATATPEVVVDIQEKLGFPGPHVLRKSFRRENLAYVVRHSENKPNKLLEILLKVPGSAIVYVRNRRRTREIAQLLFREGYSATFYHAGLDPAERAKRQEEWMKGRYRVMVSTNAFGMGIDKPDVRLVVHLDLPDSLEAYFQEAGRAGRDGKKAYAVLLYQPADRFQLETQLEFAFPELKKLQQTYRALCNFYQLAAGSTAETSYDFDLQAFCRRYDLPMQTTFHCLRVLEKEGWISLSEAVYQPSRLRIRVEQETLYDYQLKHPRLDRITKSILRTYQGAFRQPIKLREGQLANFLGMSGEELRRSLTVMERDGIIDYTPQKDKPQLTFLRERVVADRLRIDQSNYRERKERQTRRVEQAIAYAEGEHCRSRTLLSYFGETDAPLCGRCDHCLEKAQPKLDRSRFGHFSERVRELLSEKPLSLQELFQNFPEEQHKHLLQVVEQLLDAGQIIRNDHALSWKKGKGKP